MVHFADAPGRAPWLFGSLPSGSVSRGARPQNDASAEMAIGSPDRQRALAVSTTMHARRVHPPLLLFSEHVRAPSWTRTQTRSSGSCVAGGGNRRAGTFS